MIKKNKKPLLSLLIISLLIGTGPVLRGWAESAPEVPASQHALTIAPPLSEEVEALLNRGMAAAKQGEWDLAIKYLKEANSKRPYSPRTLYNLAVVYDKAGGRDLIALGWFQAYLAAAPNAENAPQVRERIVHLELATEAAILKLADMARKAADEVPNPNEEYANYDKLHHYPNIARIQAMGGDIVGAKKTADEDEFSHDSALHDIASVQVETGDVAGAGETALMVKRDQVKSFIYDDIIEFQLASGDVAGAERTLAMMANPEYQSRLYLTFVNALTEAGDMDGASAYFSKITDEDEREDAAEVIARAYAKAGNASKAADYVRHMHDHEEIVSIYLELGDFEKALKTASQVENRRHYSEMFGEEIGSKRDFKYHDIAKKQVEAGDLSGAMKTAKKIGHAKTQGYAYSDIAGAQWKQGDRRAAVKTVKLVSHGQARELLYFVREYLEADDLAGAEKLMAQIVITPQSDEFDALFETQKALALAYFKAGNLARAEETIEKMQGDGRGEVYGHLAAAQAIAGDIPGARKTTTKISGRYTKSALHLANHGIAQAQVASGDFEAAKATAELLDSQDKVKSYAAIVEARFKAGDRKGAEQTMAETIAVTQDNVIHLDNYRLPEVYQKIAETQRALGKEQEAGETLAASAFVMGSREKISVWSTFAANLADDFEVLPNFIASLKGKSPDDTIRAIVERAETLARKLMEAKKMVDK